MKRILMNLIIVGLILTSTLLAIPPAKVVFDAGSAEKTWDNDTYVNANNILMFVTNHGNFGRDLSGVFGYDWGTFYPYINNEQIINGTLTNSVLYAAGIWIGGTVDGERRVAVAEYHDEYVPGPMIGGQPQSDHPDFRVYKLYSDSLADNPNLDYLEWPVDQGAPVDEFGQPQMMGDQMLWSVFNDAGGTEPLGVEVQQTVWASSGTEGMAIYIQYKLLNKGGNTINDFYFSLWSDPDLGQFTDDLVGCDTLNDLFFCYNATNSDNRYGALPPACGFKVIHGPVVPSPGDQADFNGTVLHNYKNLGLTAFSKYINGTDPDNFTETYNYMQGLQRDGAPLPNGTRYAVPGDPVAGTGDIDTDPQDVRMMGSCGPFQFSPGDSQFVLIKFAVGQGTDRLSSITNLKANLNYIDYPETELTASLFPAPQYYMYQNVRIHPFIDTIIVARAGFDPLGDIDFSSIRINESLVPISVTSHQSWEGFNGEVLALTVDAKPFLKPYGLLWEVSSQPFTVSGQFVDETPFLIPSEFIAIGHMLGDANGDEKVNVGDAVFLINFVFKGGGSPEPLRIADANGDQTVNVGDAVYLINYVFKNGPAPGSENR